ncbi:MAG: hypothetical protein ACK5N0_08975 [Synechococcaceae cyanobacterium]
MPISFRLTTNPMKAGFAWPADKQPVADQRSASPIGDPLLGTIALDNTNLPSSRDALINFTCLKHPLLSRAASKSSPAARSHGFGTARTHARSRWIIPERGIT